MGYDQRNKCQMCVECHFALDIFHACFPSVCVCAALAFSIGLALWTFSVRATRSRKKRKPSFNRCSALDECYLSLHSDRAEPSLAHARAYRTLSVRSSVFGFLWWPAPSLHHFTALAALQYAPARRGHYHRRIPPTNALTWE